MSEGGVFDGARVRGARADAECGGAGGRGGERARGEQAPPIDTGCSRSGRGGGQHGGRGLRVGGKVGFEPVVAGTS